MRGGDEVVAQRLLHVLIHLVVQSVENVTRWAAHEARETWRRAEKFNERKIIWDTHGDIYLYNKNTAIHKHLGRGGENPGRHGGRTFKHHTWRPQLGGWFEAREPTRCEATALTAAPLCHSVYKTQCFIDLAHLYSWHGSENGRKPSCWCVCEVIKSQEAADTFIIFMLWILIDPLMFHSAPTNVRTAVG